MDGLQRSAISFRRQGSSGLVWDDKFLSGKLNQTKPKDHQQADEGKRDHRASQMQRSRSNREHTYHTVKDVGPTINPPSPKLSACGFCGMLGNPQTTPKLRSTKLIDSSKGVEILVHDGRVIDSSCLCSSDCCC
ncbi:uncharacterized protein At1g15400-like isoform X2 [Camellia sinensis]|uniref:uncharacterized protein At1g15400-like isoform X2 n=1 Tax=Camellia sinensis TaxID=4442 RepID=UPI001035E05E|nr:uncharacterized protein At1g15400-like isoform X2 [Camellia sinensis]